jgi:hypothetical protein
MAQQQQATRPIWIAVTIMSVSALTLIAAIVSFVMRAQGTGDAFLGITCVLGVVALASSAVSRNRPRTFIVVRQDEQQGTSRK